MSPRETIVPLSPSAAWHHSIFHVHVILGADSGVILSQPGPEHFTRRPLPPVRALRPDVPGLKSPLLTTAISWATLMPLKETEELAPTVQKGHPTLRLQTLTPNHY